MNYFEESLKLHENSRGKLEVVSKIKLENRDDLSLAYSPGVASPCLEIAKNENEVYKYTSKGNLIAVVTDGSAVLGLGNIGAKASLPVMEGKAILFKEFGNVDAIPIALDTNDVEEIVRTVKLISPGLGGINLEDISAPRCFEIEERLKQELDIPVFHDDQHGTAVVVLAATLNALKVTNKKIEDVKIVINGIGSAGTAITKLLITAGAKNIIACDRTGILDINDETLSSNKLEIAKATNPENKKGSLKNAIENADIFVGVSAANILDANDISTMNKDAIIFALANPNPEIMPEEAKKGGARIIGTGRSDLPNQINNISVFPGIFRGALDVRATGINEEMKLAAAYALANSIKPDELNEENILPSTLDKDIANLVACEVAKAAIKSKLNRI